MAVQARVSTCIAVPCFAIWNNETIVGVHSTWLQEIVNNCRCVGFVCLGLLRCCQAESGFVYVLLTSRFCQQPRSGHFECDEPLVCRRGEGFLQTQVPRRATPYFKLSDLFVVCFTVINLDLDNSVCQGDGDPLDKLARPYSKLGAALLLISRVDSTRQDAKSFVRGCSQP